MVLLARLENCHANNRTELDEEILTRLIPEEVWIQVLEKLNHIDKHTAYNASSYFSNLLSPLRQVFLFPSIWNILTFQLYSELVHEETNPDAYNQLISIPLNLRLVCRTWCESVDNLYETFNYKFITTKEAGFQYQPPKYDRHDRPEDLNYSPRPYNLFTCSDLGFTDENENHTSILDVFVRHFGASRREKNPFIGRRVFLQPICSGYIGCHEPCRVLCRVTNFLKLYGSHIWYCTLKPYVTDCSDKMYFETVVNWLELMPNLKTLHWELEFPRNISANDLKDFCFPKLPYLVAVYLIDVPHIFIHHLLEENNQIGICEVNSHEETYSTMDLKAILPNLNSLSLELNNESFQRLENFKDNWKLKRISLCFKRCDEYIEWHRVFDVLERWKGTVKNLSLELPIPRNKKECMKLLRMQTFQLNLPNVKRMRLILPMLYLTKHFTGIKSSLELLEVVKLYFETEKLKQFCVKKVISAKHLRKGGLFDLYEESDIHHSNMWRLFPKLRRFDYMDSHQAEFQKHLMEEPHENYCGRNIRSVLKVETGGHIGCLGLL